VLTPAALRGMGMVLKATELAKTHGWFLTRQFENEANPDMHSRTTAREIIEDFAGARLDYWVTGFGTGGTLKGVARVLAKERPDTKIVVCEPDDAPMLSSGEPQQRRSDGTAAPTVLPFLPGLWLKEMDTAYAVAPADGLADVPGPNDTHGSDARSYWRSAGAFAAHAENGSATTSHDAPPFGPGLAPAPGPTGPPSRSAATPPGP